MTAEATLRWAYDTFARVAIVASFQAESSVIIDIASKIIVRPIGMPSRNTSNSFLKCGRRKRRKIRNFARSGMRRTTQTMARNPNA